MKILLGDVDYEVTEVALTQSGKWRIALRLSHYELRQCDIASILMNIANQFETDSNRSAQLCVVLSELFNNALDHGLLELDSRLKADPDGMDYYLSLRRERLRVLDHGEIDILVEKIETEGRWHLLIQCKDTGIGFNTTSVLERGAADETMLFGRGLQLLRSIASQVTYNDSGNEATVIL